MLQGNAHGASAPRMVDASVRARPCAGPFDSFHAAIAADEFALRERRTSRSSPSTARPRPARARLPSGWPDALGFHYLDSGALYRLVAWQSLAAAGGRGGRRAGSRASAAFARAPLRRRPHPARWAGCDRRDPGRRRGPCGVAGRRPSRPCAQRPARPAAGSRRQAPGLVADGRDMGTVVFPDATLKVYLTASVEARADRRLKQLIEKGFPANIADPFCGPAGTRRAGYADGPPRRSNPRRTPTSSILPGSRSTRSWPRSLDWYAKA